MINLETIDLSVLPWASLDATAGFPAQPGIYFAIDAQGKVQYIGKTVNLRQRWVSHHKYDALAQADGVRIAYLTIDEVSLLPHIETALIHWFRPPLNLRYTGHRVGFKGMLGLRLRAGKRAEEVAVELKVAVSTVRNWDQLVTVPRMTPLGMQRLLQVYNCTFEELVEAAKEAVEGIE